MCAFAMIVITDPNNKRAGRAQRGAMQMSRGRLSGKEGDQYVIKKKNHCRAQSHTHTPPTIQRYHSANNPCLWIGGVTAVPGLPHLIMGNTSELHIQRKRILWLISMCTVYFHQSAITLKPLAGVYSYNDYLVTIAPYKWWNILLFILL